MSTEMPSITSRKINAVGDYIPFFHTLAYLRQRAALFLSPASDPVLMSACGYAKSAKFARHRAAWDVLRRDVPLSYLRAIGADLAVLSFTAEIDLEEFHAALSLPSIPRLGSERLFLGFGADFALPEQAPVPRLVEILRAHSKRTGHECCANFSGLKRLFVAPTGAVKTIHYEPRFSIIGGFLRPERNGRVIHRKRY